MTTTEIIDLLYNAIDCNPMDAHHSGYTAKEIHRKCLVHIQILDQQLCTLRDMRSNSMHPCQRPWIEGKDE